MTKSRSMRIVLYEPSGRGGVCHYTYQLAEHLARAGVDVTLITTEDYELKHLARHFRLDYLFTRSWLTRLRQRRIRRHQGPAPTGRITTTFIWICRIAAVAALIAASSNIYGRVLLF